MVKKQKGYTVTVSGPVFVNPSSHMKKGLTKVLKMVGKDAVKEVKHGLPKDVTGNLRRNIKESKPNITSSQASISISSGSTHGGAVGKKSSAGDVIYAFFIETGIRGGRNIMKKRKGGYRMFQKAAKIFTTPKKLQEMKKLIAKEYGGK